MVMVGMGMGTGMVGMEWGYIFPDIKKREHKFQK